MDEEKEYYLLIRKVFAILAPSLYMIYLLARRQLSFCRPDLFTGQSAFKKPLRKEHVKPRLLGHWGTKPGLNFIYAHLNRIIQEQDLNMFFVTGPGHGGPALVANAYKWI